MAYSVKSDLYYSIYGTKVKSAIKRTEEGYCLKIGNQETIYKNPTDVIDINLYGYDFKLQAEHLFLISAHSIMFTKGYAKYLYRLKFVRYDENTARGRELYTIYFDTPIVYMKNSEYRLIPAAPRYGINKEGEFVDTLDNKYFKVDMDDMLPNYRYPMVSLVCAHGARTYSIHRLVATTWIDNPDQGSKHIVDHINGNKHDYKASNLRWATLGENNRFTAWQGIRSDNIRCFIKNLKTNEYKEFASTAAAAEYMGGSRFTLKPSVDSKHSKARVIKTAKGIFQIKSLTDPTPWITHDEWINMSYSYDRYVLKILNGKDLLEKYSSTVSMSKALGLKYIEPDIYKLKDLFIKKYPYYTIAVSLERVYRIPTGYLAYNRKENKMLYDVKLYKLAEIVDVKKSSATKSAANGGGYEFNGWSFKIDDGKPFKELADIKNKPMSFEVTNVLTNEKHVFPSLRSISNFVNKDKKTVGRYLGANKLLDNKYRIERIETE